MSTELAENVMPAAAAVASPERTAAPTMGAGPGRGFTVDGSAELEQHLARSCAKIAAGVRGIVSATRLEGLLLGGGYGRGEGGVLRTPAGDRPYNDLEFYVFLRGNRHVNELRFGHALHVLGEILTPQAGIEVEFKIASRRELAASPVSMFSYDLAAGHRWFGGSDALLAGCRHHYDPTQIPLSEATRLLMNRASGLLFARERLERRDFTSADADFVRRNIAKAELACGDAVLVTRGNYHWSVRERHHRLASLAPSQTQAWWRELLQHHATGVEFKLHPQRSTAAREELAALHARVTRLARHAWFHAEAQRFGREFASPLDYVVSVRNKWPKSSMLRNAIVQWRALGSHTLFTPQAVVHPRARILNALALLLWEPRALSEPSLLRAIQGELHTTAQTFPDIMCAYRALWSRVN